MCVAQGVSGKDTAPSLGSFFFTYPRHPHKTKRIPTKKIPLYLVLLTTPYCVTSCVLSA